MALNRSFDVSQGNFMCSVGPMGVQWVVVMRDDV